MKVHILTKKGNKESIECESVWESDHGIYTMSEPSKNLSYATGYVPYDQLDFVEPDDNEE